MPTEQTVASDSDSELVKPDGRKDRNRKQAEYLRTSGSNKMARSEPANYHSRKPNLAHGKEQQYFVIKIPIWLCGLGTLVSVVLGAVAVLITLVMSHPAPDIEALVREVQERTGSGGINLFKSYDINRDGYLSIIEFEPLLPHLKNLSSHFEEIDPMETYLDYSPEPDDEIIIVQAHFSPLKLETMTKEDILTKDITGQETLFGLKNWTQLNREMSVFGASEFKSFLPEDMGNLIVGKPYHILQYAEPTDSQSSALLSNNRYYPPVPKGKDRVLFRLLGMMHRNAFLNMRFPPRGTVACVQAFNEKYVHLVFRAHAEFQLNEPPLLPFWFTPAQFLGELVIDRNGSHISYFHMQVPKERRLNVDMEWLTRVVDGEQGMEVDIGYMPRMEWTVQMASSLPLSAKDTQSWDSNRHALQKPDQIRWTSEMAKEDVLQLIEVEFYPFKKVTYHNLTHAVQLSKEHNRPMHAVFLWGALDDQSC